MNSSGNWSMGGNPSVIGLSGQLSERCVDTSTGIVYTKTGLADTAWTVAGWPLPVALGGTGATTPGGALDAVGGAPAGLVPWSACRIVASGNTTVNALTTVTVATFTRTAGEVIFPCVFMTNAILGLGSSYENAATLGFSFWFERTTNANEATFRAKNIDVASRTMDWMIVGIKP